MLQFLGLLELPEIEHNLSNGFAYDGDFMYFITKEKQIVKISKEGKLQETLQTQRPYEAICFDSDRDCFWAVSKESKDIIFQLSHTFEETHYIQIYFSKEEPPTIRQISYCPSLGRFLLLCNHSLYECNFNGNSNPLMVEEETIKICGGALMKECLLCIEEIKKEYYLTVFNKITSEEMQRIPLLEGESPKAVIVSENKDAKEKTEVFVVSLTKEGKTNIMQYTFEYKEDIRSMLDTKEFHDLLSKMDLSYEKNGNQCNQCNQYEKCYHCICLEILESIAYIETSLSHILNAEGEKIQMAVCKAKTIDELLKVNESVQDTIMHTCHLEQVLLAKMECALKMCQKECKKNNECCRRIPLCQCP